MTGTVFDIEREARWRVWALFALLLGLVFGSCWLAVAVVEGMIDLWVANGSPARGALPFTLSLRGTGLILGGALLVAVAYWFVARIGARGRLVRLMHAQPLDPGDRFHQRLADIVAEMRLATGAPQVTCLTVPTLGMNAFAFSDLHGAACIGVTEGALSRLSRQQLEAVVAHEFGHVLSGDYVTATTACLLFGVYATLGEAFDQAIEGGAGRGGGGLIAGAGILRVLVALMQAASAVTNAAISRQREWVADMAAVRYTRDPLSLAQALHMMSRHPGGVGFIPDGLSSLCIRATDLRPHGFLQRAMATHPPLDDRIVRLLNVAHVGWDTFEARNATAEQTFAAREHTDTPPGADSARPSGAMAPAAVASPASLRAHDAAERALACPSCGASLESCSYEGVDVFVCRSCAGRLASGAQVLRILARRQVRFSEEQERLADWTTEHGDQLRRAFKASRGTQTTHVACPRCGRTMLRRHFSYDYAVEIDVCTVCDLTWFEKYELEVVQILAERVAG